MVVPDSENPGPFKKRPRLALKARKAQSETSSSSSGSCSTSTHSSNSYSTSSSSTTTCTGSSSYSSLPSVKEGEESVYALQAERKPKKDADNSRSTSSQSSLERDSSEERDSNSSGDEKDKLVPQVSSLENLGNTCFLNSVLQILRYTPMFLDNLAHLFEDIVTATKLKRKQQKILEAENSSEESVEDENSQKCLKVVQSVYKMYKNMSALEGSYEDVASDDVMSMSIRPNKVLSVIREMNTMYEGCMQHDAQEFLRCLLSFLQDAEKEVKSFYRKLPAHPAKSPMMNPIMQTFLNNSANAQEEGTASCLEAGAMEMVIPICEEKLSSSVKVNLFPKPKPSEAESGHIEPVPSPKKSSSGDGMPVTPQLGDTAGVVDEKIGVPMLTGSQMTVDTIASQSAVTEAQSKTQPPSEEQLKSKSSSKQSRRYKPYETTRSRKTSSVSSSAVSSLTASTEIQTSKSDKLRSALTQLDDTVSKVTAKPRQNKRKGKAQLGENITMTGSSTSESSVPSQGSNRQSGASSNTRGQRSRTNISQPSITSAFEKTTEQVKLKRLGMSGATIHQTIENCYHDDGNGASVVKATSDVLSKDKLSKSCSQSSSSSSQISWKTAKSEITNDISNEVVKQEQSEGKSHSAVTLKPDGWMDEFTKFIVKKECNDEVESLNLITDSEDEDIVQVKKMAKHVYESPRRSPRKSDTTPRKLASLCSSLVGENCQTDTILEGSVPERAITNINDLEKLQSKSVDEFKEEPSTVISTEQHNNYNTSATSSSSLSSPSKQCSASASQKVNSTMVPFIKLEKCDHVFNKDVSSKSVSANFAEKYLSPSKLVSPKKTLAAVNTAKRSIFQGSDKEIKKGLDKALREFYKSPQKDRKELMEGLFQGTMMLQTKCLLCESVKERREEFHDVSVPVQYEKKESDDEDDDDESNSPQSNTSSLGLMRLIQASMDVERLLEDNKYFCEDCRCYVEAERSIHYEVLPDILTIHLKRFSAGQYGYFTKLTDHIDIPMSLPCLRYRCSNPCTNPDHRYTLYGLVTHTGVTLSSGHYLAYVRAVPKHSKQLTSSSGQLNFDTKSDTSGKEPHTDCEVSGDAKPQISQRGRTKKVPARFKDSVVMETKSTAVEKKATLSECLKACQNFKDNDWFECDDETIRVFDEDDFNELLSGTDRSLLGTPYLLFYHKASVY